MARVPNNKVMSRRVEAKDAATPMPTPSKASPMPWPTIRLRMWRGCAPKREANSHFLAALVHRIGHHGVDAHGRQQQGQSGEDSYELHDQAGLGYGF